MSDVLDVVDYIENPNWDDVFTEDPPEPDQDPYAYTLIDSREIEIYTGCPTHHLPTHNNDLTFVRKCSTGVDPAAPLEDTTTNGSNTGKPISENTPSVSSANGKGRQWPLQ